MDMCSGQGAGHPDEDELYEAAIVSTNVVYEVTNDELVVLPGISETMPKIEILDPSKVCNFFIIIIIIISPFSNGPTLTVLVLFFRRWFSTLVAKYMCGTVKT